MTYEEALEEIHGLYRFGSKLGLSRMSRLMELLGNIQDKMNVIHVAGTNGKGSVCRYVYAALTEQGYRVGLYTSPFIEVFNERIECCGEMISDEDLAQCTDTVMGLVREMVDRGEESPTEFEVVTAIAFVYFQRRNVDYVVLEVGLGGRGDSTNVVRRPVVSVITSISFDHMEYLGDTLPEIAGEKAGIIKDGCPVVYCIKDREAAETVRSRAAEQNCAVYDVLGTVEKACVRPADHLVRQTEGYGFDTAVLGEEYPGVRLAMAGSHQVENACCALTVIEVLKKGNKLEIEKEAVYRGFQKARQIGRFEVLQRDPYVIIDGAHNDDGARALAAAAAEQFAGKRILLICGILADKEVDRMIAEFGSLGADMAATEPDNPRRLPSAELCARIRQAGYPCEDAGDYRGAIRYGKERLSDYDAVIYAGSLYLVGKIREGYRIENE
ncbi:bifunctional folylpolyglutamate synthase/dihydrofolate synthase [Bacilliculturomica massiliensis]|uniref:bifunctional folylpolyglutamate synthase/dihydrofolate synthase n=1 Tax=Bacilliculturomica massiliensis TaxID=1917867 RepID=UPI0010322EF9|nr:folylpolyglutamate synthase/dihydrofolate synthase family protein [Bacilliculturomica massiliensis]